MQSQQSETQTSVIETPLKVANKKAKKSQKTKKKKIEQAKVEEETDIKTQKKAKAHKKQKVLSKPLQVEQQMVRKTHKVQTGKVEWQQRSIYQSSYCQHSSVYKKLFISILLTIFSMTLFTQPSAINYPVAEYEQGEHKAVFEIVTDRKTRNIKFNIKDKKKMGYLPIESIKTARVNAKVEYSIGYEFQNQNAGHRSRFTAQQNHQIQMSGLKILHYSIEEVSLQNKQNGIWNSWQFQSTAELKQFIKQHYIEDMKKQTLEAISVQRKKMYENQAKFMLTEMVDKYESWFDWLLKRIDNYVDGGLQPYLNSIQIKFKQNSPDGTGTQE